MSAVGTVPCLSDWREMWDGRHYCYCLLTCTFAPSAARKQIGYHVIMRCPAIPSPLILSTGCGCSLTSPSLGTLPFWRFMPSQYMCTPAYTCNCVHAPRWLELQLARSLA